MLPKSGQNKTPKLSLEGYRFRGQSDVFACVMVSYTQQASFDMKKLQSQGLYGSLVCLDGDEDQMRYLSPSEGAILMGALQAVHAPFEKASIWKILGNCIAVPHALVLMWNAFKYVAHDCGDLPMFAEVADMLVSNLKSWNVKVSESDHGYVIGFKDPIPPAQVVETPKSIELVQIVLSCGTWQVSIRAQAGLRVSEILKTLHAPSMTCDADEIILCESDDNVQPLRVQLRRVISHDLSSVRPDASDSRLVLILTGEGPVVLIRQQYAEVLDDRFRDQFRTLEQVSDEVCLYSAAGLEILSGQCIPQVSFFTDGPPVGQPFQHLFGDVRFVWSAENGGKMVPLFVLVKVKFMDESVFQGFVQANTKVCMWAKALSETSNQFGLPSAIRTVVHGRTRNDDELVANFLSNEPWKSPVRIFLVRSLHGGAGSHSRHMITKRVQLSCNIYVCVYMGQEA